MSLKPITDIKATAAATAWTIIAISKTVPPDLRFSIENSFQVIEARIRNGCATQSIKVERDFEQGFQALEYKLNTVGSSRGDYPFVTFTFGLGTKKFEKMATIAMLKVRKGGQGAPGFKKAVLFPKLVFLFFRFLFLFLIKF